MEQLNAITSKDDDDKGDDRGRKDHYLASWLSWAAPMVGLSVDVSKVFISSL